MSWRHACWTRPRGVLRALAWLATLGLLGGCFLPQGPEPLTVDLPPDKVAHLLAFGAVTFLWRTSGLSLRATVLVMGALAILTEVVQALFIEGRTGEWGDLAADAAGLALGLALAQLVVGRARTA